MYMGGRLTPEEFWARFDAQENEIRAEAARWPCRGLADWPGWLMLAHWAAGGSDEYTSIGLSHGQGDFTDHDPSTPRVDVSLDSQAPEEVVPQRLLNAALPGDVSGEGVFDAMRRAEEGPIGTVTIAVDGRPEVFDQWVHEQTWFATRRHQGHTVTVQARHVRPDELDIVRVRDIEPYLAGRRAALRRARGEG